MAEAYYGVDTQDFLDSGNWNELSDSERYSRGLEGFAQTTLTVAGAGQLRQTVYAARASAARTATSSNPVPNRMARVIPGEGPYLKLGPPSRSDVFVTAADDIAGMNSKQISRRLTIAPNKKFTIIEFNTPRSGVASPINRPDLGFIGGGRTAGGAREFVIPNQSIPTDATIRVVQ